MRNKIVNSFFLLYVVTVLMAQIPHIAVGPNGITLPTPQKNPQMIMDHQVLLQENKLQPWTSYDMILRYSMNYLKYCPAYESPNGPLPLYLITSKILVDGNYRKGQNNQGGNAYWAMETFKRYYAYTGDMDALNPVKNLVEQIAKYHTPSNFAWPGVPRTQDDTPDGIYDDEKGEPDKACMVAIAYINYSRFTGEQKYIRLAENIANTIVGHITEGTATESPLPFRVNMRTGKVIDPYCADMIMPIKMIDELLVSNTTLDVQNLLQKKMILMNWILKYPMENNIWSGYFEDVATNRYDNVNQFSPMETARYLINNPNADPLYKQHILKLIILVKQRFGVVTRYGATSIAEQDDCLGEMSSHTSRYASVVAKWFGMTGDEKMREEARASFALSTYSAFNKFSKDSISINYTGIGFVNPWFSDSYLDYMSHFLEGFGELPEMMPIDSNHLFYTTSMVLRISYEKEHISYTTFDKNGLERLKLTFEPMVYANGKKLPKSKWHYGKFRGINHILTIHREGVCNIEIRMK